MALLPRAQDDDGSTVLVRITWAPGAAGYTQTIERSTDAGATWTLGSTIAYDAARRRLGWREQPGVHALMAALAVIVHDILRHGTLAAASTPRNSSLNSES